MVFSNNCEFKSVEIYSKDIHVVQLYEVKNLISSVLADKKDVLNESEIDTIYRSLYPLTQVSEEVKNKHAADVRRYM